MGVIPNWEDAPAVWDTLRLGGKDWPGVWAAAVEGGCDADIKKSDGADGATITYKGRPPKKVSLSGRIMARDWDRFQALLPDIEPNPAKKKLIPLGIVHPDVNARSVTSIAVLIIKTSRQKGFYDISIDALEFNKSTGKKSSTTTPTHSSLDKPEWQRIPLITPDPLANRRPSDDPDP